MSYLSKMAGVRRNSITQYILAFIGSFCINSAYFAPLGILSFFNLLECCGHFIYFFKVGEVLEKSNWKRLSTARRTVMGVSIYILRTVRTVHVLLHHTKFCSLRMAVSGALGRIIASCKQMGYYIGKKSIEQSVFPVYPQQNCQQKRMPFS